MYIRHLFQTFTVRKLITKNRKWNFTLWWHFIIDSLTNLLPSLQSIDCWRLTARAKRTITQYINFCLLCIQFLFCSHRESFWWVTKMNVAFCTETSVWGFSAWQFISWAVKTSGPISIYLLYYNSPHNEIYSSIKIFYSYCPNYTLWKNKSISLSCPIFYPPSRDKLLFFH